jgi:putative addiction module component (TIGR02574 family)
MKPEVKYRIIEKLIQTEDDGLLMQIEAILLQATALTNEHKKVLDERLAAHSADRLAGNSWEQVKNQIKKRL